MIESTANISESAFQMSNHIVQWVLQSNRWILLNTITEYPYNGYDTPMPPERGNNVRWLQNCWIADITYPTLRSVPR